MINHQGNLTEFTSLTTKFRQVACYYKYLIINVNIKIRYII